MEMLSRSDCIAALRGLSIPPTLGPEIARLCVIRGIRYHDGFASELNGTSIEYTRALNARAIMSNRIPSMTDPATECAYCIWHPQVAKENTYRILASRYPALKYQIGRACAVAGYTDLYRELLLLPEISIAEEARDSGSMVIFESIVNQLQVYRILDDYQRVVTRDQAEAVPGLNCDTAVRSSLDIKQAVTELKEEIDDDDPLLGGWASGPIYREGFQRRLFDITEDQSVDERDVPDRRSFEDVTPLLYSPLPRHLPALRQKDLLIHVAASEGNIDRYIRLRRPSSVPHRYLELDAVVRGIYHHPFFAKWASLQPQFLTVQAIQNAITARFIMSNDVSRVTAETKTYQIWYPAWASPETYAEVLRRCPSMRQSIARAGIVTGQKSLFTAADPDPSDRYLGIEAKASLDPWFMEELKRRAAAQGKKVNTDPNEQGFDHIPARNGAPEHRPGPFPKSVNKHEGIRGDFTMYDGRGFNISPIAGSIIASEEVKTHPMFQHFDWFDPTELFPGSMRLEHFEKEARMHAN